MLGKIVHVVTGFRVLPELSYRKGFHKHSKKMFHFVSFPIDF